MGIYDTKALPIYQYLHAKDHPNYAIADNFFQAAFGGSFLNHQWLIAAASPVDPTGAPGGANAARHPVLDANGMPSNEPLYTSTITPPVPPDRELTATCAQVATLPAPVNQLACGNYGVNTMQPPSSRPGSFGAQIPAQTNPTIGDRLTDAGVDWAWYSGGWSNANGDVGAPGLDERHGGVRRPRPAARIRTSTPQRRRGALAALPEQPVPVPPPAVQLLRGVLDRDAGGPGEPRRAPEGRGRVHAARGDSSNERCNLKPVSFVKPIGEENEHPGYASEPDGSDHLVDLLKSIEGSKCAQGHDGRS